MMFLVRSAFWIGVVIMLIPVDDEIAARATAKATPPIGAFEAVSAAQSTLQDMNGFCDRNPDVCEIGGRVATTFALKARTGAEMLVEFVDTQLGGAPEAPASTDRGTLTPDDLAPAWRGDGAARPT